MSRSQLFVGRLPIDIREREVEQVFDKYGRLLRCDVKYGMFGATGRRGSGRTGMAYAFIDYDDRRDAEDAIKYENGRELRGQSIVVEWARGPAHRSGGGRDNYGRNSRQVSAEECYRCRRPGHWARDCPESDGRDRYGYNNQQRYRQRSRSRSRSRRHRRSFTRSRSRSRERERRRRSPSDYRQKSESMSPRQDKRRKRSQSGSASPTKSASRSRSRSHGNSSRKDKSKKRPKRHGSGKSETRTPSKSHSRSRSPEYSGKPDKTPPRSPEEDYVDPHDNHERNNRSSSRSPRKSVSRSPVKERYRSDDSGHSVSRSKSR